MAHSNRKVLEKRTNDLNGPKNRIIKDLFLILKNVYV